MGALFGGDAGEAPLGSGGVLSGSWDGLGSSAMDPGTNVLQHNY